jgi:hypothetical protein
MEINDSHSRKQHSHTAYINIICFIFCFICGGVGGSFPRDSFWQNIFWEITNALFITGCALTSVQLADRKWIIPAAGFIVLSISFIEFFTLIPIGDSPEKILEIGKCGLLFIPAMVMISYYTLFPLWLRMMGVISCLPFIAIIFFANLSQNNYVLEMMTIGYILIEITSMLWGIYFLKILRRELKQKS